MLLHPTEMNVQFMEMLQKRSKRRAFGHLGEGVHVLGETLATIAKFDIGTGYVCVRVVDVAREQHSRVHLAPVGTYLFNLL